MRYGVYGAVIKEGRLLFVKNDSHYILPGGKPNEDDGSEKETLRREFSEEISGTRVRIGKYYGTFRGKTPNSGKDIEARVYLCELEGEVGKPSAEITDVVWVGREDVGNYEIAQVSLNVFNSLDEEGYLLIHDKK